MEHIYRNYYNKSMTYAAYRKLIDDLFEKGETTGTVQSPELTDYARLNIVRMNRLDKTAVLNEATVDALKIVTQPQVWFVLTEGWCGDAAQIVPVLNLIANSNANIELRLLLRDENLDLMDHYLVSGRSRSIPRLIVVDVETDLELFNWGPRPKELQDIYSKLVEDKASFDVVKEKLHSWYAKDKTLSTQREIMALVQAGVKQA
ncbi:MAG: thioredoxin family protein [Filimonas sp.]|nr:thioredoxin family protein [Filimonas sp.]